MSTLEVELDAGVLALRLNRPERLNALNADLIAALRDELRRAEDESVRVVTMTGNGSSFCSGADVREVLSSTDRGEAEDFLRGLASVLELISGLGKPVVAGFQGHAAGGGAELALEADLRVAAEDAVLWFPDVGVGSTPASLWRLVRMAGQSVAAEMAMLGRSLGAGELLRFGVVTRVVPRGEVPVAVADLAARLRDGAGAVPLRYAKRSLRVAAELDRRADLEANIELMLDCFSGADQRRAVQQFAAGGEGDG